MPNFNELKWQLISICASLHSHAIYSYNQQLITVCISHTAIITLPYGTVHQSAAGAPSSTNKEARFRTNNYAAGRVIMTYWMSTTSECAPVGCRARKDARLEMGVDRFVVKLANNTGSCSLRGRLRAAQEAVVIWTILIATQDYRLSTESDREQLWNQEMIEMAIFFSPKRRKW